MAKVLIVDDEEPIVALMKVVLERCGHTIISAANGQEALQVLGVNPPNPAADLPDVVILDVMMPVMDGYTAAIAMRNAEHTARLPILVVTAKGDMRRLFEALPAVAGFFDKPFDPKDLRDAIANALKSK